MNIIEAVKTGLPIRRVSWWDCLTTQRHPKDAPAYDPCLMFPDNVDPKLTREDILADDWVIGARENIDTSKIFKGSRDEP